MEQFKCAFCGDFFIPKRRWARFCSDKCRNNYNNDRRYMKDGTIPAIKCTHCMNDNILLLEKLDDALYLCTVCSKEFICD